MSWTYLPVSVGDEVEAAQIAEVKSAIDERIDVINAVFDTNLSKPDSVSTGDTCLASDINAHRGAIEALVPYFVKSNDGAPWTFAAVIEDALGEGRTDWTRVPDRIDDLVEGSLVAGDVMYAEHINDMRLVLNKLTYISIDFELYSDGNGKMGLYKSAGSDPFDEQDDAVDDYWDTITSADLELAQYNITTHPSGQLLTYQKYDPPTTYSFHPSCMWSRIFYKSACALPDLNILDARTKFTVSSFYQDDGVAAAWPNYTMSIIASSTSPGTLTSGDWNFAGSSFLSFTENQIDTGGSIIASASANGLTKNTVNYFQARGMEGEPAALDDAVWLANNTAVGTFNNLQSLWIKLDFQYR